MKTIKYLFFLPFILFFSLMSISCDKDGTDVNEDAEVSKSSYITDVEISNLQSTSSSVSYEIPDTLDVSSVGVYYSIEKKPDTTSSYFEGSVLNGHCEISMSALSPNTKFYILPYIELEKNGKKVKVFGPLKFFTTPKEVESNHIENVEISKIGATSATITITADKKVSLYCGGIYYNTTGSPDTTDKMIMGGHILDQLEAPLSHLSKGTKYYILPFIIYKENGKEVKKYGDVKTFSTLEEENRPSIVSSFVMTATEKKTLLWSKYVGGVTTKCYRTYSEVTYNWNSGDSNIEGLVATTDAFFTPQDGVFASGSNIMHLDPNGTRFFPDWENGGGYYYLYIWSYDSNYIYSKNYYRASVYVAPTRQTIE